MFYQIYPCSSDIWIRFSVGFDFDYTLVTYTDELLELIYEKALQRLVTNRQYPKKMLEIGLQYDPFFSIRGLAVDKETGKYCMTFAYPASCQHY
jgi:5' nucleotidase family